MKKGLSFLSGMAFVCAIMMFYGVSAPSAEAVTRFTVAGGSVGGSWSIFTEGAVEAMRRGNKDYQISAEPGSTTANPGMIDQGKVEMGVAFGLTALQAYQGKGEYKTPMKNLRAVCGLIPVNAFQFVMTDSSGITSFDQLKSKKYPLKVSVDSKGSTGDILTAAVLKAYGITYADVKKWGGEVFYLSSGKTFEMMADNRMNGTGDCIPVPAGDLIESSTSIKMHMLPMSDEAINKVCKELGMNKTVVPANTYSFQKTAVPTINTPVILLVNANVPADQVYNLVKSLHQNMAYLKNVAKGYAALNDKTIVQVNNVPFHPGAAKYFKEVKLIK
jgi:TRAP transporter TAXI family solute receptor